MLASASELSQSLLVCFLYVPLMLPKRYSSSERLT